MRVKNILVAIISITLFTGQSFGVRGFPFIYAPAPALDSMVYGLAALVTPAELKTGKRKVTWKTVANLIYIGENSDNQSVLLTQASGLLNENNELLSPEELSDNFRFRFGPTVSSFTIGKRNFDRDEYRFLPGTIIIPFRMSKKGNRPAAQWVPPGTNPSIEKRNDLALIVLPYKLEAPQRPIAVISKENRLSMNTPYLTFGHGNEMDEPSNEDIERKQSELDKSSGFLRFIPMKLSEVSAKGSQFTLLPLKNTELEVLHQRQVISDTLVYGPCQGDWGAPLLMVGSKPVTVKKDGENPKTELLDQVALVGLFQSASGICERPNPQVKPHATFTNLLDRDYQDWIQSHVSNLKRTY